MFTHLNTTLNGLATVRAFKNERFLKTEFDNLQDTHTSSWYMFLTASAAYLFILDFFTFIFTVFVIFSFLLFNNSKYSHFYIVSEATFFIS